MLQAKAVFTLMCLSYLQFNVEGQNIEKIASTSFSLLPTNTSSSLMLKGTFLNIFDMILNGDYSSTFLINYILILFYLFRNFSDSFEPTGFDNEYDFEQIIW